MSKTRVTPGVTSKLSTQESISELLQEWISEIGDNISLHVEYGYLQGEDHVKFYELSTRCKKIGYFIVSDFTVAAFFIKKEYRSRVFSEDIFKSCVLCNNRITEAVVTTSDKFFLQCVKNEEKERVIEELDPFIFTGKQAVVPTINIELKELVIGKDSDEERIWKLVEEDCKTTKFVFDSRDEVMMNLEEGNMRLLFREGDKKNEEIVGFGGIQNSSLCRSSNVFFFVSPRFRRMGIGTYIISKLINECVEKGKVPNGCCKPNNIGSIKTMERAGMVLKGEVVRIKLRQREANITTKKQKNKRRRKSRKKFEDEEYEPPLKKRKVE